MTNQRHLVSPQRADWRAAHHKLVELSQTHATLDLEEGAWLLIARQRQVHARLGFASFAEYVQRLFGYSPRFVREKLRVAEALTALPATTEALRSGDVNWSITRELTRVATPETEAEWLAAARHKTAREIEQLVSGLAPGKRPGDPPDPTKVRHTLRLDVSAETLALFREAMAKLRRDAGEPLDDDAAIAVLSQRILQGPGDAGRVRVAPKLRRAVLLRDHGRCVVPGCGHATFIDVHHLRLKSEGGTHDLDDLVALCSAHHRATHQGLLSLERVEGVLHVRHADGTPYGASLQADASDARAKAFAALRRLGFGEAEVRRALANTPPHVGHGVEALVRSCLVELTSRFRAA